MIREVAGRMALAGLVAGLASCAQYRPPTRVEVAPTLRERTNVPTDVAALFVRVSKDGSTCQGPKGRLRPLKSGGTHLKPFYSFGEFSKLDEISQLDQVKDSMKAVFALDFQKAFSLSKPWTSFVTLPPGDYALTSVSCRQGNTIYSMGSDHSSLLNGAPAVAGPIRGANVISLRPGEIVDAGTLDIREERGGWLQRSKGRIVAIPASQAYREDLKAKDPELFERITFASFMEKELCDALPGNTELASSLRTLLCGKEGLLASRPPPAPR